MTMKPAEALSSNSQAVADSLAAMMKRERTTYSCYGGYLNTQTSDPNMITADDRTALVDWCYSIIDHCQLSRQTVASAMEMVDRFLSVPSNSADVARVSDEALRDQSKFQLLTIAALYTSIKINERVAISSDLFAEMSNRLYTAEEIEDTERTLLSGLSWRCYAPTAHEVGMSILSLILPYVDIPEVAWGFLMDEMKYLTELAVRDYYFTTQRASTVALAAVFNVVSEPSSGEGRQLLLLQSFLRVIMECFDFDDMSQIAEVRTRLQSLTKEEETSEEDNDDDDERSLDDSESGRTFKISNLSSGRRDLERNIGQEMDEYSHVSIATDFRYENVQE